MANLVGKTLGKYELTERLGSGGMAEVYKAYHPILDRYVTIKILHSYLAEGEDFLARFKREARAVASLRHPHIQQIHDFDIEDDHYYMVMEFIDWGTLQNLMMELAKSGAYMPVSQVLSILRQVGEALDYAHKQGIIHRDIKPSNILLDSSDSAFLSDFGIARMMSGTQFTATGSLIGTPTYMSPEQGRGDELTTVSDIYSLGVILFELLTGKVPFTSETTPLAIIHKHIHEPPPKPRALRPDLPEAVEQVLLKALAKDPQDRYQSAGELVRALEKALPQEAIARLDQSSAQAAAVISTLPTMLVEAEPAAGRATLPTVAIDEGTRAEILPPHPKKSESRIMTGQAAAKKKPTPRIKEKAGESPVQPAAAVPVIEGSTRVNWMILIVGLGFLGSRCFLEYLAGLTNFYGLGLGLAGVEIFLGVFGLCVGALLWWALRSSGLHLGRVQIIALLAIWSGSFLAGGLFAFSIDAMNGTVWDLGYALAGLLGGSFTGLVLAKAIPHFGARQVLLLAGSSAILLYLDNFIFNLGWQFWSASGSGIGNSIKHGLASGLAGILITWILLLLVRPKQEAASPAA